MAALIALLGPLAGGCGDGDTSDAEIDAAVYAETIRWLLDEIQLDVDDEDRHVFVESREPDDGIRLEVQAEVVNQLDGVATVRFVDAREEAVEEAEPGQPVRNDGMLIGLGEVSRTDDRARLYVDAYRERGSLRAYELVLEARGDGWSMVEHERVMPRPDR